LPDPIYLTLEPDTAVAGESWLWQINIPEYSADDGWTLEYEFTNQSNNKISFTTTPATDGSGDHVVNQAFATTALYEAGGYNWAAFITDSGDTYKIRVNTGFLEVVEEYSTGSADPRSHARRTLDAIEATIEGRATKEQQEVKLGETTLKFLSLEDLIKAKKYYQSLVSQEEREERQAAGDINRRLMLGYGTTVWGSGSGISTT